MLLMGGCDQVRFGVLNGSEASRVYSGQNYTDGKACGIFDPLPEGGGLAKMKFPASWLNPNYNDVVVYALQEITIGAAPLGTNAADEMIYIKYLSKPICDALNLKLTGSKTLRVVGYGGSTYGQASQYNANLNGTISAMSASSGGGSTLTSVPACHCDSGGANCTLAYDIAQH